tara:strand:+ start:2155 stop:3141 length:987 start_codon:yes stop_codon:yes gene_type:complete
MNYLSDSEVSDLLQDKMHQVIESVESAFLDKSAEMVPKIYLNAHTHGDFRAMPAALGDHVCLKWIGVYPTNHLISHLPTTLGTLLLNDRETGKPLMAMDCTTLTAYRTAATSAIAAKYCAPEAREFAFIGCGLQAQYHIEAYESIFGHMNMTVETHDRNRDAMKKLHEWIGRENIASAWGYNDNAEDAVKHADVVTTLTPSTEPYLDIHWLKSNCHINAVGADAVGKRELMTNVIDGSANIVCDDLEQALHSGELQYNEWPHLEVNSLQYLLKNYETMQLNKGVSVFDSTGVAIEDAAIATLIWNLYREDKLGEEYYLPDSTSDTGGV